MLDILGAGEEGSIASRSVGAGEEGVSGGPASGSLHVVAGEGATAGGEGIDVGRMDVVDAEALEFRAEVINADEEDVLFCREQGRENEKDGEKFHGGRVEGRGEFANHEKGERDESEEGEAPDCPAVGERSANPREGDANLEGEEGATWRPRAG